MLETPYNRRVRPSSLAKASHESRSQNKEAAVVADPVTYVERIGVILILAAFSWAQVGVQEYVQQGANLVQIITRMIPLILSALYLLNVDLKGDLTAIRLMFKWPALAFVWYAAVSAYAGLFSRLPLLALWKSAEVLILVYWGCHARIRSTMAKDPDIVIRRMVLAVTVYLLYVLAAAFVNPGKGWEPRGSAIPFVLRAYFPGTNPNAIGVRSAIALYGLLSGGVSLGRPFLNSLAILGVATTTLTSQSRTAYIALLLLGVLYSVNIIFRRSIRMDRRNLLRISLIFFVLAFGVASANELFLIFQRGQETETIQRLSGRIDYWQTAMQAVSALPWLGGGMATGSRFLYEDNPISRTWRMGRVNLHSSFVEILTGAGLVGGGPLILAYLSLPVWIVYKLLTDPRRRLPFIGGVGAILVLRALTSITLALFSTDMLLLMLVLFGMTDQRWRSGVKSKSRVS